MLQTVRGGDSTPSAWGRGARTPRHLKSATQSEWLNSAAETSWAASWMARASAMASVHSFPLCQWCISGCPGTFSLADNLRAWQQQSAIQPSDCSSRRRRFIMSLRGNLFFVLIYNLQNRSEWTLHSEDCQQHHPRCNLICDMQHSRQRQLPFAFAWFMLSLAPLASGFGPATTAWLPLAGNLIYLWSPFLAACSCQTGTSSVRQMSRDKEPKEVTQSHYYRLRVCFTLAKFYHQLLINLPLINVDLFCHGHLGRRRRGCS